MCANLQRLPGVACFNPMFLIIFVVFASILSVAGQASPKAKAVHASTRHISCLQQKARQKNTFAAVKLCADQLFAVPRKRPTSLSCERQRSSLVSAAKAYRLCGASEDERVFENSQLGGADFSDCNGLWTRRFKGRNDFVSCMAEWAALGASDDLPSDDCAGALKTMVEAFREQCSSETSASVLRTNKKQ